MCIPIEWIRAEFAMAWQAKVSLFINNNYFVCVCVCVLGTKFTTVC